MVGPTEPPGPDSPLPSAPAGAPKSPVTPPTAATKPREETEPATRPTPAPTPVATPAPAPVETGTFPPSTKPPAEATTPAKQAPPAPAPPTAPGNVEQPGGGSKPASFAAGKEFLESVKAEILPAPVMVEKSTLPSGGTIPFEVKTGQPAFSYARLLKARFPKTLNQGSAYEKLPARAQEKWVRIFAELRKASNFRDPEQSKYLFIDQKTANKASLNYEKDGSISLFGAWTIAVGATAVRYDFADRPCAEFVSEMIRQAYKRAGYSLGEDFNVQRDNKLIHESSHAVRGLSKALDRAGWIPWDASKYRPPVGAPAMHESGLTPGHTYLAAGDNGLWIVDNSKPRGRDLRKTDPEYVNMMYRTGLFFLPPGLNPHPWIE